MLESLFELSNFLVGPFAVWALRVFLFTAFFYASCVYAHRSFWRKYNHKTANYLFEKGSYWVVAGIVILFKFLYAAFLSVAQYYIWSQSKFTEVLVSSPLSEKVPETFITKLLSPLFKSSIGYVAYYSYGRFFLNVIVVLIVSFSFWAFLRILKRHKERFFEEGEVEFGLVCALIAGWPGFIVFIPLTFISVVIVSIFRGIVWKEVYTTLGYPLMLATLITLIFGNYLIEILNLGVFRI